jgi:hypothetical protein
MLQDVLARLAPPTESPANRLDVARRVMNHLPETAWLRRNAFFADHQTGGDAGLYDLLLNPRDRSFDIPSLFALIEGAGLRITCLMEPLRYDPATWLPDPKLRALVSALDPVAAAALAESLTGNMSTHVIYCTRAGEIPIGPNPLHPHAVPIAREMPGEAMAAAIRADGVLPLVIDGLRVPLALPALTPAILRLIDGQRSLGQIAGTLAERGVDEATFARAWAAAWPLLSRSNRVLLAAPP